MYATHDIITQTNELRDGGTRREVESGACMPISLSDGGFHVHYWYVCLYCCLFLSVPVCVIYYPAALHTQLPAAITPHAPRYHTYP